MFLTTIYTIQSYKHATTIVCILGSSTRIQYNNTMLLTLQLLMPGREKPRYRFYRKNGGALNCKPYLAVCISPPAASTSSASSPINKSSAPSRRDIRLEGNIWDIAMRVSNNAVQYSYSVGVLLYKLVFGDWLLIRENSCALRWRYKPQACNKKSSEVL